LRLMSSVMGKINREFKQVPVSGLLWDGWEWYYRMMRGAERQV
jgi:hypothetical protein